MLVITTKKKRKTESEVRSNHSTTKSRNYSSEGFRVGSHTPCDYGFSKLKYRTWKLDTWGWLLLFPVRNDYVQDPSSTVPFGENGSKRSPNFFLVYTFQSSYHHHPVQGMGPLFLGRPEPSSTNTLWLSLSDSTPRSLVVDSSGHPQSWPM